MSMLLCTSRVLDSNVIHGDDSDLDVVGRNYTDDLYVVGRGDNNDPDDADDG